MVTWIKGTFLMVLANMSWSLWIVKQAAVLKEYPNKMLIDVITMHFQHGAIIHCRSSGGEGLLQVEAPSRHQLTGNHLHWVYSEWGVILSASMVCGDERPCLLNCLKKSTLPYIHNILLLHPRRNCSPRQYSWWYTSGWRPDAVV
ncbi:hypothetical protein HU200_060814 [Digitaria exilis]|uniref:Secreted protein n=1 Tax=Digitaria exilis TaxID=1010633 RepID=A0A835A8S2_9POAL|nr:hypothetical protein HU200_060814 [Digitaria exilis]